MMLIQLMMRYIQIFVLIFTLNQLSAQQWRLVWEDQFDSLNTDRWLVQNHFDHYGGELQVYTSRPENVFVDNGNLILRVLRESYTCPPEALNPWGCARQFNTGKSYDYTSGWVETKPAYNTQYGYIEARISLPYGRGFWPAFWTFVGEGLPTHTNAAEIDIFEMYGHKPATNLETNVHLEYCNPDRFDYPGCPSIPSYHKSHLIPSYANKYHVYGCEWTPEFLKFKFNGVAIRVMNNPGVIDPVRIIMNMAILVGDPPTQFTPFPSDIKIDYVRVYEQVQSTGVPISEKSDEISVYPNPANHFITIQLADLRDVEIEGVEVVNMFGQTVKSVREISDTVMDLDIDDLEKGMYQIIIQTNKGSLVKTFSKM
jgi:beta-glucanase (GH16 family)